MTAPQQTNLEWLKSIQDYPSTMIGRSNPRFASCAAEIEQLVAALREMENGYRTRCNYCQGNPYVCEQCPSGGCRAPKARAALAAVERRT